MNKYRLTVIPSHESMRFLRKLQRQVERELGRKVTQSELFDAMCSTLRKYAELRETEPHLQATGHRGLPGHRPGP